MSAVAMPLDTTPAPQFEEFDLNEVLGKISSSLQEHQNLDPTPVPGSSHPSSSSSPAPEMHVTNDSQPVQDKDRSITPQFEPELDLESLFSGDYTPSSAAPSPQKRRRVEDQPEPQLSADQMVVNKDTVGQLKKKLKSSHKIMTMYGALKSSFSHVCAQLNDAKAKVTSVSEENDRLRTENEKLRQELEQLKSLGGN